ncbi:MAG: hypothetical protein EHM61_05835 [Acidobacteria bacterium]|nr:MAG: hypothetical protein EHM61_05835 [Acidobacteriota bacterium]
MRPRSLAEVARLTLGGQSFDLCLGNFLDEFYALPESGRLEEPPPLLSPPLGEPGRIQDAYLAAVAEELANRFRLSVPQWTSSASRALREPWFALPLASLRAVLILESPPAFRARNLFVSENALSRV